MKWFIDYRIGRGDPAEEETAHLVNTETGEAESIDEEVEEAIDERDQALDEALGLLRDAKTIIESHNQTERFQDHIMSVNALLARTKKENEQ